MGDVNAASLGNLDGGSPVSTTDIGRQRRLLSVYALVTAVGAGGAAPAFFAIGAYNVGFIQVAVTICAWLIHRLGKVSDTANHLACHLLLALQLGTLVALTAHTGGLTSAPFFALCLLPLCATFLVGMGGGRRWSFVTMGAIAGLVALTAVGWVSFQDVIPTEYWIFVHGSGPLFLCALSLWFAGAYTQERDDALTLLRASNRRIARDLGKLEAQFEAGFEHSPIGMALLTPEGNLERGNPALCRILGRTREELHGLALEDFFENRSEADLALQRLVIGNQHQYQATVALHRAERIVWSRTSMALLYDANGRPRSIFAQFEDISESIAARDELAYRATHDDLTGLPNRAMFTEALNKALSELNGDNELAVFFVNIDRFKFVNDGLGHATGDALLAGIAHRLVEAAGPAAVATRIGGDEFAVLTPLYLEEFFPSDLALWMHESFRAPISADKQSIHLTLSIGFARCRDRRADADELLRHADAAMFEAKGAGRATTRESSAATAARLKERFETSRMLALAFERNEFSMQYQPEVDLSTGELLGVEALLRWHHPTEGLLSAGQFIHHAEDTGLIVRLGAWVLREAFNQAGAWNEQGFTDLVVRVNIAAAQVRQAGFVDEVCDLLSTSRVPASSICLEITETALLDVSGTIAKRLQALRDVGIGLAIDDFGTGYASLGYLKSIPATELKIDYTFIANVDDADSRDRAIVETILLLADRLGFGVVAEGIERQAQATALLELGCTRAQGFLMHRPMSPRDIPALVSRRLNHETSS